MYIFLLKKIYCWLVYFVLDGVFIFCYEDRIVYRSVRSVNVKIYSTYGHLNQKFDQYFVCYQSEFVIAVIVITEFHWILTIYSCQSCWWDVNLSERPLAFDWPIYAFLSSFASSCGNIFPEGVQSILQLIPQSRIWR